MKSNKFVRFGSVAMAAAVAGIGVAPVAAFAAKTPTVSGEGIDKEDGQQYTTTIGDQGAVTGKWEDSATESATDDTINDHMENTYDGNIHLFYDTTGGQWQDPGKDPEKADDNTSHDNGTFVVTIPTKIAYENMNIGKVDTSDDYTVNVRGAIAQDKKVTLAAETGQYLVNGSKDKEIQETTTQDKTEWSAADAYGHLNTDGSLSGTDSTDNIKMTGTVTTAGTYEGAVQYTASLVAAAQS